MEITLFHIIFAALIFMCLGSAITAYVHRTPMHEEYVWRKDAHHFLELDFDEIEPVSFFKGRSQCPKCLQSLKFKDLIPVLSFVLNKQRCRHCNEPISWRYFTIEVMTLLFCMPLLWFANNETEFIMLSLIFCTLITISIIDWQHKWIPDQLNILLLGLTLCHILINGQTLLQDSVIGMLIGYFFVIAIRQLYLTLRKIEAIGLGDAKLLAALGAWQGLHGVFAIVFIASLLGVLYALINKKTRQQTIAFGPFLCLASVTNYVISFFSEKEITHVFSLTHFFLL